MEEHWHAYVVLSRQENLKTQKEERKGWFEINNVPLQNCKREKEKEVLQGSYRKGRILINNHADVMGRGGGRNNNLLPSKIE